VCVANNEEETDEEEDSDDEKEVYGVCDCCGMEGKFFGEEGDDWTCPTCLYGNCSCDNTSDEEDEDPVCCKCGEESDQKGNPNSKVQLYDGDWYCGRCYGDPAEEIKAQIKHLLADLDRVEGRGGVQRFITEELRYLF
jgi:hypothetical protein